MPTKAKLYIGATITLGFVLLNGWLLFDRNFSGQSRYFSYLLLAGLASTMKIKLPKIRGTMSISFLFILIGVVQLTAVETITLACVAPIQLLWNVKKRPTLVQVLFNISAMVTSIVLAFSISHLVVPAESVLVLLAVAVCIYFLSNTGMVSLVLALIEKQSVAKVWRQCYLWSFPYYLIGAGIAGAVTLSSRTVGWQTSLLSPAADVPGLLVLPLVSVTPAPTGLTDRSSSGSSTIRG